jgi:Ca2+-binding RTX toxin-like protein
MRKRRIVMLLAAMALALVSASGVALAVNKIGTHGPDTLRGTNGGDHLQGKGGDDIIFGLRGSDILLGGSDDDTLTGGTRLQPLGGGEKKLYGGSGNDFVGGGNGSDAVKGGKGIDYVADGDLVKDTAEDKVYAGAGNDGVQVANATATKDKVKCGGGFDRVLADRKDVLASDCERVFFGTDERTVNAFFGSFPRRYFEIVPFPVGVGA